MTNNILIAQYNSSSMFRVGLKTLSVEFRKINLLIRRTYTHQGNCNLN